jgi:hypothetical protein
VAKYGVQRCALPAGMRGAEVGGAHIQATEDGAVRSADCRSEPSVTAGGRGR